MKKIKHKTIVIVLALFIQMGLLACGSDSSEEEMEISTTLSASKAKIDLQSDAGSYDFVVTTNANTWTGSSSGASWINLDPGNGNAGSTTVKVSAAENPDRAERSATITLTANGASPLKISVTQAGYLAPGGGLYPNYNTNPLPPDATGMGSTASELASKISLGWNIGNSLEATGSETAWGNPKVGKALIDLVKQNGFNAIRIPCSWNQYMSNSTKAEIKTEWLNRVKEVIQYCIDNDMYVLLNIHWDGGWLENNVTEAKKVENNAKQKAFWEQIATHFRNYDEHLLFASANEPNVENAIQMAVLTSYHQTFIDAVRSTGGRNTYRTLVIQGPSTDIEKTNTLMTTLPLDPVANRMMVEVHYYTPWQFCGMEKDESWGKMFYYWGADYHAAADPSRNATWGEEQDLNRFFVLMKNQFTDRGIPVVLGEFSALRRSTLTGDALTLHLASRAYFLKYTVKQAKANGLLPFYWDNGGLDNFASGIFDRKNNTVSDSQALDALLEGLK
jgi:aryl-phospho-beta-D-glucosidase BglC (GH1 family)